MPDPVCGERVSQQVLVPPVQAPGPHVAALGMRFYTGTQFPAAYRGQIFIAGHGSWNSSLPIGRRLTMARLDGIRAVFYDVSPAGG